MESITTYLEAVDNRCAPGSSCSPSMFTNPASLADSEVNRRFLSGLDFLWLEITPKCNLRCLHCYSESGPTRRISEGLQYEDWRQILVEAALLGCEKVQFIGGEPTLYPHLNKLVKDAREQGFSFLEVFTNGTILTDSMFDQFKQSNVNLAFSVYASEEDSHDDITQTQGSFARTMESMREAILRGIRVRASVIRMPKNSNQIEKLVAMLSKMGVTSIQIDGVRTVGRGKNFDLVGTESPSLCGSCWQGKLCIDSRGMAFPCVFARDRCVGHVRNGIQSILDSLQLSEFRATSRAQQMRGF